MILPRATRGPETLISYSLPRAASVRLVVHDVRGRVVRTLVDGLREAGEQRVAWDGNDARGVVVAPGVYLCRLETDGATLARKVSRTD